MNIMALNMIFASTQAAHRERLLSEITVPTTPPTTIQPGTPVVINDRPAVALTADPSATLTKTTGLPPEITSVTYKNGGVNSTGAATFAFDGTWVFDVTGALTNTADDVEVYIDDAGALTLTVGTNTHYGWTDYPVGYIKAAGRACVRVGA